MMKLLICINLYCIMFFINNVTAQINVPLEKRLFLDYFYFNTMGILVTDTTLLNSTQIENILNNKRIVKSQLIPISLYIPCLQDLAKLEVLVKENSSKIFKHNIKSLKDVKSNVHWYYYYKDINGQINAIVKFLNYTGISCHLNDDYPSACRDLFEFWHMKLNSNDKIIFVPNVLNC